MPRNNCKQIQKCISYFLLPKKKRMEENNGTADENKPFIWTAADEVAFLKAAVDSKPIGVKKNFEMAGIMENLYEITGKVVPPEAMWQYLQSIVVLDALDEREDVLFPNEEEDFRIPTEPESNEESDERESEPVVEEKTTTLKVIKDYSRVKDKKTRSKAKEEVEPLRVEKAESATESEEEDTPLKPAKNTRNSKTMGSAKKTTPSTSKKEPPKRGTRAVKDALEKDSSPASTSSKKADEEVLNTLKRDKVNMGKRSLRSRGEDDGSNKSSSPAPTPPPTKRPRRI